MVEVNSDSVVKFMPNNQEDMGSNLLIVLYIRTVKCPFPMSKITDSAKKWMPSC